MDDANSARWSTGEWSSRWNGGAAGAEWKQGGARLEQHGERFYALSRIDGYWTQGRLDFRR